RLWSDRVREEKRVGMSRHRVVRSRSSAAAVAVLLPAAALAGCSSGSSTPSGAGASGIHKIRHVVVIMQENRSFDTYFGTYPGADGIPMSNGVPTVCVPDPKTNACQRPYHDPANLNLGGSHQQDDAVDDVDGGAMDGFIARARAGQSAQCVADPQNPVCSLQGQIDVMGWHDAREIPNYWTYAKDFVLQDKMFEPNLGWSLPSHLFMVSGWAAHCSNPGDAATCTSDLVGGG